MPKRGRRNPKPVVGDLSDPRGMAVKMNEYLEWMRIKNYSERTVGNRELYLGYFIQWAEERGITRPAEVTKPILERYQRYLYHYRKQTDGKPLSFKSQHNRLIPIKDRLHRQSAEAGPAKNRLHDKGTTQQAPQV